MCNYAYNVVLFNKWANSQMSQNVSVSIEKSERVWNLMFCTVQDSTILWCIIVFHLFHSKYTSYLYLPFL